ILGHWILRMAEIADKNKKEALLTYLISVLPAFFDTKSFPVTTKLSSLLFVKIVLRLGHVNMMNIIDQKYDITSKTVPTLGKVLGIATWNAQHEIRNKKINLESPSSLTVFQDGFPLCVANFFNGFIETLQRKKHEVLVKKRKESNLPLKAFDKDRVLTHMMSSLCRKPKLYHSLYNILCIANVVSHTQQHERILEKTRRHEAKPKTRLLRSAYIWNVLVIDNIDFIEKIFAYGNIYDAA
ncbi:10349_t:CDS:2, partial [Dentiscutata heterogama]